MAKIVTNELAPEGAVRFSLAAVDFEVPYETEDRTVLSNAAAHPWLSVEYPDRPESEGVFIDRQVKAEDDPLSRFNDNSNDPEAVAADRPDYADVTPLAVDAGLDQGKAETVGEGDQQVAVTLAADDTDTTEAATYRRVSAKKEN